MRVDVEYTSIGSGGGKAAITKNVSELEVDYAGSDSLLTEEQYEAHPDLQMFPTMAGAVVMAFNLPGVTNLTLSRHHIVGLYNGSITHWNDSGLQALNEHITLPSEPVYVVARSDKSGTTEIFTKALNAFDSSWSEAYGYFSEGLGVDDRPVFWNSDVINAFGNTNRGVAGLLLSIKYSVSYLSVAEAKSAHITYASIVNKRGNVVSASTRTIQNAMDSSIEEISSRFTLDLVDADGAHAYPILGYTYMILRMWAFTDCERTTQLYRYIHWFSTSETAQRECQNLYMASLSAQLARRIESEVLSRMRCRGEVVSALVAQQIEEESRTVQSWVLPVSIIVPIAFLLVVIVTAFLTVQQLRINRAIWKKEYLIPEQRVNILIYRNKRRSFTSRSSMSSSHSIKSDQRAFENRVKKSTTYQQAIYNEQEVQLRKINLNPGQLKLETKRSLLWMRDKIHHLNVLGFYGICLRENATFIVSQSCSKGILRDTLQNDKFNLDINFKFSMSCDLGEGLHYLHKQGIYHGAMTSSVCLIDGRWTVKICDWEIGYLMKLQGDKFRVNHFINNAVPDENIRSRQLFWSAPEVLVDGTCRFTEQADVYSLGIIIIEIFTREDPFDELSPLMEPKEIIEQVATLNIRPLISKDLPTEMQSMLEQCWDPQPKSRPTAASVVKTLNAVKPSKKSVLDCMMSAVENYAVHLEEEVEARTVEVKQTMTKLQLLLHQILPPTVADKLSCGESVDPEFFDSVTVFFSDIVGFTALSSESSAFEIVTMLNELYTQFDSVIDKHEVYKVETIGDAYMCVSGCPNRNGDKHAEHIANMAINLAIASAHFRISHVPDSALRLRVGIHSGPVAAGVVGLKMPRYCLFGDTVNTAARMESTSVAMKIQVSEKTKDLLDGGHFLLSDRKEIEVKGKGKMKTYWLHGLADSSVTLPPDYLRDCV